MSDETADLGADDVGDEEIDTGADETEIEAEGEGDAEEEAAPAEHQESVPDPAKAAPKKAEPEKKPAPPRTYKVKVNGRDQEIPADDVEKAAAALGVEVDALLGGTRMFRAANEKFQKAAEVEKQHRALMEQLKADPRSALRDVLGEDGFAQIAVAAVQEMMQAESLTPEQRRIKELEAEQSKVKAQQEAQRKAAEEQAAQRYQEGVRARLDKEITAALESGKLPKDPYTVRRLAAAVQSHLSKGGDVDDLQIADFVPVVQDEMKAEFSAFMGNLSGEDVIARFPDLAEKVRKAYAARVGRRQVPDVNPGAAPKRKPAETPTYGSIGAVLRDF